MNHFKIMETVLSQEWLDSLPPRHQRRTYLEKLPPNTKLVARPTRYGNPHKVGVKNPTREFAVQAYIDTLIYEWGMDKSDFNEWIEPLRGKTLACYCPLDQPCHADALRCLANVENPSELLLAKSEQMYRHGYGLYELLFFMWRK